MIKTLLLLLALCFATLQAQGPRMLQISRHGGATDTVSFVRIDSTTIANQTDFAIHLNRGGKISVPIDQIDSIMFPPIGGPAYEITQPSAGQVYHVGDSLIVQWNRNPFLCGIAGFIMSTDAGKTWHGLTNEICFWIRDNASLAGTPCCCGLNYAVWTYIETNGKYVGTWKFKISNPMSMPDSTVDHFNPISDSVIIRITDMHCGNESDDSELFSIKP